MRSNFNFLKFEHFLWLVFRIKVENQLWSYLNMYNKSVHLFSIHLYLHQSFVKISLINFFVLINPSALLEMIAKDGKLSCSGSVLDRLRYLNMCSACVIKQVYWQYREGQQWACANCLLHSLYDTAPRTAWLHISLFRTKNVEKNEIIQKIN